MALSDRKSSLDLLLVPAVSVAAALAFIAAKGPYWLGLNFDPDYQYLFSSLNIAEGLRVYHTDHPGTFVQILGGGLERLVHLVAGRAEFEVDVVARPELYLLCLNTAFILLVGAALWLLGRQVHGATQSVLSARLAQATPLLSATLLPHLACAKPEPVLLALSALTAALAVKGPRRSPWHGALFGLVAGAALATKITAIPLLIVPLLILGGWRAFAAFFAATAATVALATIPAWHDLGNVVQFAQRIATHSGRHGRGAASLLEPAIYLQNLGRLVLDEPIMALTLLAAGAVLVRGGAGERSPLRRVLLALCLAQVASLLMVARHPADQALAPGDHYLVPGLGLAGASLAIVARLLQERFGALRHAGLGRAIVLAGLAVFCLISLARQYRHLERRRDAQMAVVAYADEHYPEADVVYYYRSSSPAFALHFGDMWAGERHTFLIAKLHPRARFFSVWSGVIEGPDLDPAVPAIMQGTPHPDGRPGFGRYAARVFGNESEAIFELR